MRFFILLADDVSHVIIQIIIVDVGTHQLRIILLSSTP